MKILYDLYKEYGYGVVERATPGPDGLFPVERRVLLGVHLLAKNKFIKSAKVVGEIFGRWHPHSPESIYQTLAKLVRRGLVQKQGNFGRLALQDAPPAAMRYTEVKEQKWVGDLAFRLIDFVPWKEIEGTEAEPTVLPSPIPLLIGSGTADGISYYKFTSLLFNRDELLKALEHLVLGKEDYIPRPNIEGCVYSGSIEDFWYKGVAKLVVKPKVEESKEYVDILGKLYNISTKKWEQANISWSDLSQKGTLRIRLYKRRGLDINKYIPYWNVQTSLIVYYNGQLFLDIGLSDMMLMQWDIHVKAYQQMLEHELDKLHKTIYELDLIEKIKQIISKHPGIQESGLLSMFKGEERKAVESILSKYPIKTLFRIRKDRQQLNNKIKDIKEKLKDVHKSALSEVMSYAY